jgi:hypothetical protein
VANLRKLQALHGSQIWHKGTSNLTGKAPSWSQAPSSYYTLLTLLGLCTCFDLEPPLTFHRVVFKTLKSTTIDESNNV